MKRNPSSLVASQHAGVVDQDPGRLAVALAGGHDRADRVEIARVVEPPGHAQAMRQVGRPDEQDVDLLERGDLVGAVDGARRLDLDDADDPLVDDAGDVGVAERAHVGAAGPQGDAPLADRRVAQVRDGLADGVRRSAAAGA